METRYLFDARTGELLAVASPEHVKARDAYAGTFRPGIILVDELLEVVELGCREADTARPVFVSRG